MAVRKIIVYPEQEKSLRKKSEPVKAMNRRIKKLVRDLKDTLATRSEGIGLAAPQVNVHLRVIVVRLNSRNDNDDPADPPIALINPEIVSMKDEKVDFDGCLSLPGIYADTMRPHYLRVTGLDEKGKPFDRVFEGFDAVLVHHEIDHLEGVLFIDRVNSMSELYRVEEDDEGTLVKVPIMREGALV